MTTLAQPIAPSTALSRSLLAAAQQLEALGNHETNVIANRLRDHAAQAAMLEQRARPNRNMALANRLSACVVRVRAGRYSGHLFRAIAFAGLGVVRGEVEINRGLSGGVPVTERQMVEVRVEDLDEGE
jgi:hypothetical protein